jgi:hypothetical protein
MTDEMAREVAAALLQNLISFHKGRRASARTPISFDRNGHSCRAMVINNEL